MSENLTGIMFGLLTVLSWTFCIFPFTQAARRIGSNTLNHFRLMLAAILVGLTSLAVDAKSFEAIFSEAYRPAWCWLGLSGFIGLTLGDYFAFRMYAILGARIGSVLTTLAPAAALIFGGILTNEHISWMGISGIFITIVGIANISFGKRERNLIPDHGHGSIAAGIIWGILGAFGQGAGLVMAKKAMLAEHSAGLTIHPLHATFIRVLIAFSVLLIVTMLTGNTRKTFAPIFANREGGLKYATLGTLFGPFIGVCMSLFTISHIDASVAQTIFSLVPVTALLFAMVFLKEKITLQSFIGVFAAVSGVLILIWRDELTRSLWG
jgi:drug/metabolite transporter (DMT)-like permease